MKIKDINESTTSGSVATVATPLGKTQSRAGKLFKGKKTNKPFYEDEVNEADLILVPGHGKKIKPGFIPKDKDRTDHEVEMARSDLYQAAKNAKKVYELIQSVSEEQGLEGWVQEKIIKANDYLNTIREYLEHKTYMQEMTGGVLAGGMSNFEEGVAEGSEKNVVKSVKVGNFRHDLVDTGMGWQVRIYNGDELYDTGMSKNSEQKGLAALEDAVAYTEKQTRAKRQGVAEAYDIDDTDYIDTLYHFFDLAYKKQQSPEHVKYWMRLLREPDNPGERKFAGKLKSALKLAKDSGKFGDNAQAMIAIAKAWRKKHLQTDGLPDELAEEQIDEKKDACYSKVKSRYKVWPSAYASGALVKCRKVGASNWGNKSKK